MNNLGARSDPGGGRVPHAPTAVVLGLLAALVGWAACTGAGGPATGTHWQSELPAGEASANTEPDALRGTIAVVGAQPLSRVVLQTREGAQMVVTGRTESTLRRLDGVEIRCNGRMDAGRLRVSSFRVVGVEGLPARDGILEIDGRTVVLVDADGQRIRYTPIPSALRQWVGQRVWIAGPPDGAPEAWGLIGPAGN